jgi:type III secretion system FlhB-like substrate exporter
VGAGEVGVFVPADAERQAGRDAAGLQLDEGASGPALVRAGGQGVGEKEIVVELASGPDIALDADLDVVDSVLDALRNDALLFHGWQRRVKKHRKTTRPRPFCEMRV